MVRLSSSVACVIAISTRRGTSLLPLRHRLTCDAVLSIHDANACDVMPFSRNQKSHSSDVMDSSVLLLRGWLQRQGVHDGEAGHARPQLVPRSDTPCR